MKSKFTISAVMLASFLILGLSACKKDKNGNPEPEPVEVKTITITELRALSTSVSVKVPDNMKVKGIVISDAAAKNIDSKTVILQEATDKPGIIVTFDAAQTFAVGDEVELTISNQTLAQTNGEVILQNISSASATKTGTGTVTARQTTIADIKTNKAVWNGTLVSINATNLTSADGKYKGMLTANDASGDLTSTVVAGATFENNPLPLSVSKLTGIVRVNGNDVRIDLRNASDVVSGGVTTIEHLAIVDQFGLIGSNSRTVRAINPVSADAGFTAADLFYSYLILTNTPDQIKTFKDPAGIYSALAGAIRPGAKEVTVTFAGSVLQGVIPEFEMFGTDISGFTLAPFNPTQHNIKIGIGLAVFGDAAINTSLIGESPAYNETGKFYTFKVKLPSTTAELTALGMNNQDATEWLANPKIAIYNLSTKRSTAGFDQGLGQAPVIVGDKVAVGY